MPYEQVGEHVMQVVRGGSEHDEWLTINDG
jgi:hypothetical protein